MLAPAPMPSWWHVAEDEEPSAVRFQFECAPYMGHPEKSWECPLVIRKCDTCSKRVRISPSCALHLWTSHNLAIRPSTIPGAGWGLFAHARPFSEGGIVFEDGIVFKEGNPICKYAGDLLTKEQLDDRYGEFTAPYAAGIGSKSDAIDAACSRSAGAMANHASGELANAYIGQVDKPVNLPDGTVGIKSTLKLFAWRPIKSGDEIFIDYIGEESESKAYSFEEPGARSATVVVAAAAAPRPFKRQRVVDPEDAEDELFSPTSGGAANPVVVTGGKRRPRGRKSGSRRRRQSKTRSKSRSKTRSKTRR